jgi:predicted nucleotidyltransferase
MRRLTAAGDTARRARTRRRPTLLRITPATGITGLPSVDQVVDQVCDRVVRDLRDRLVGLYLHGSLVTGEWDERRSDIDLLVVLSADATAADHRTLDRIRKEHGDRLDLLGLPVTAFEGEVEPANRILGHRVRSRGIRLAGLRARQVIPAVPARDYLDAVRWRIRQLSTVAEVATTRLERARAVTAICQELCVAYPSSDVGREQAVWWAERAFPGFAPLIRDAATTHSDGDGPVNPALNADLERFLDAVANHPGRTVRRIQSRSRIGSTSGT